MRSARTWPSSCGFGKLASTRPRREAVQPLANFFQTRDGRWLCLLARQGSTDWARIATAAGRPELTEDPRFASARLRRENGAALVDILDEAFGAMDYAEAAAALDAGDLTWAPWQTPRDLVTDPQAAAAGCFVETPDGRAGPSRPGGPGAVPWRGGRARGPGAGAGRAYGVGAGGDRVVGGRDRGCDLRAARGIFRSCPREGRDPDGMTSSAGRQRL